MNKSRFTEEEIVAILAERDANLRRRSVSSEADRGEKTIGDVCRAHGVSEPTF